MTYDPCSIGILVDRGLGGSSHVSASNVDSTITVYFFGGPDDREALALGRRMSQHPGITLIVVHFRADPNMEGGEMVAINVSDSSSSSKHSQTPDEEAIDAVKQKLSNDGSIKYEERVVKATSETIEIIKEFSRCHMILIGQSPEGMVAATFSTNVKTEYPEIGPVGGFLISQNVSTNASVLVMHQYSGSLRTVSIDLEEPTNVTEIE